MYVQASERFPGIALDMEKRTIRFSIERFGIELEEALSHFEEPEYFDVSETYSAVYRRFLELNLSDRPAIRGQLEGPVSFGLNVLDQDQRPILFNDTVRSFMLDFLARRINAQLNRLKALNPNAFMFVDEPGSSIFSAPFPDMTPSPLGAIWSTFSPRSSGPAVSIFAGTRTGIFSWVLIWMSFRWTCTPTAKFSSPTLTGFDVFWNVAAAWSGEWCLPAWNPSRKKASNPLKLCSWVVGRLWKRKESTLVSCFPEA